MKIWTKDRSNDVHTRLKALDEIYKIYTYASLGEKNRIYTHLHRSDLKMSAKFRPSVRPKFVQ